MPQKGLLDVWTTSVGTAFRTRCDGSQSRHASLMLQERARPAVDWLHSETRAARLANLPKAHITLFVGLRIYVYAVTQYKVTLNISTKF